MWWERAPNGMGELETVALGRKRRKRNKKSIKLVTGFTALNLFTDTRCEAQILRNQCCRKSSVIVLAWRCVRIKSRDGIVDFRCPWASSWWINDFIEYFRVQTETNGQVHGFGCSNHADSQHHVVTDFCCFSHAVSAAVCNSLSHA